MAVPPVTLRANTDSAFVGVAALTARHAAQIADFEAWAAAGQWGQFHHGHYDWWAYPIMRSSAYGLAYTVYEAEIAQLNADPQFVERHRRGLQLGALAWGWDVPTAAPVAAPAPGQAWTHWPVRLYKMARSAREFGYDAVFESLAVYARQLMAQGEVFQYGGHDLSWLFTGGREP